MFHSSHSQSYTRRSRNLAIGLAALAGLIDSLGFLSFGGFFVSFMSGNSTRFAVGFISGVPWWLILTPLGIIFAFVVGVMSGRLIRHGAKSRPSTAVLVFVACALIAAAVAAEMGMTPFAVTLMAIAMGSANNVFVREGEVSVGVTYMTGTLVKLGQRLTNRLLGQKDAQWLPYLLLWLGLVSGAILGAVGYRYYELHMLWAGVALTLGLGYLCFDTERAN